MRNIVNDPRYIREREEMMEYVQDQYHKPEETEKVLSTSGKFNLEVHHYHHEEGIRRYSYSKGVVRSHLNEIIDVVYRNYPAFLFSWTVSGSNEYLLCGLDYQGYSIIDLSNHKTVHYVPESAYEGQGFCWGEVFCFPEKDLVVVDGCYWACPYELVFLDFTNPMVLPYKELFRVEIDQIVNWDSWKSTGTVRYIDENGSEREYAF